MLLKPLFIGMTLGGFSTIAMSAEVDRSRFDGIIYNERVSDLGNVGFRSLPTRQEITRAFSPKSQSAYRIRWDCSISSTGHLTNCKVEGVWPINTNPQILSNILNRIQLDSRTVNNARKQNARLYLTAYLDDGRRTLDRSCPLGWCPITPAPPENTSRP